MFTHENKFLACENIFCWWSRHKILIIDFFLTSENIFLIFKTHFSLMAKKFCSYKKKNIFAHKTSFCRLSLVKQFFVCETKFLAYDQEVLLME